MANFFESDNAMDQPAAGNSDEEQEEIQEVQQPAAVVADEPTSKTRLAATR